jgi:hypothetical protein
MKLTNLYRKNWKSHLVFLSFTIRDFAVNLTGGQPKMYWFLCCTGVSKWCEIACICHQTHEWTINSLRWLCLDLELTPVKFMTSYETQDYMRIIFFAATGFRAKVISCSSNKCSQISIHTAPKAKFFINIFL